MTEYFQSKRWAITGRLTEISRKEATAQLKERGASVTGGVTSATNFLVSGGYDPNESRFLSSKEKSARQFGIPIFNEPQLLAILAGETPDLVEELAPEKEEVVPVGTRDALEGFRELVAEELTEGTWTQICELLDRCEDRDLAVVLPYVESFVGDDGPCPVTWWDDSEAPNYHHLRLADPRSLPSHWVLEMLGGGNHPKYALARVADLRRQKIKAEIANNLLACEHLGALRALDLADNAPPNKFWKAAATLPQFAKLSFLGIGGSKINASTTSALAAAGFAQTLDTLKLDGTAFTGNGAAAALFADGAFSNLERLDVSGVKSPAGTIHYAVREATHISGLTHLAWNRVAGAAEGFGHVVAGEQFAGLTHLRYTDRGLGRASLTAIAQARHLQSLKALTVLDTGWQTPEGGMDDVMAATQFGGVQALTVSVDPPGLDALMRATHLESLTQLYVTFGREQSDAWELFFTAPQFRSLERLYLGGNLPAGFLGRLLASDALPAMTHLQVYGTGMTDMDLRALVGATHRSNLVELKLHSEQGEVTTPVIDTVLEAAHVPDSGLKDSLRWARDEIARGK
jgi:hypothetical protein